MGPEGQNQRRWRICVLCICRTDGGCWVVWVFVWDAGRGLTAGCAWRSVGRRETSVSGGDKGGQQDTHHQHIVVELMLIELVRHCNHTLLTTPSTALTPNHPPPPPPPLPLPILASFFCPPTRPGHSAIMGNNLLQKTCIFGWAKTREMRP